MKKSFLFWISIALLSLSIASCDKVEFPYGEPETYDLDTTLYPGSWSDYIDNIYPDFPENTNTDVNVLIEDFTGHRCTNCPPAADKAHAIKMANPNRVFVASIHSSPGGMGSFQMPNQYGNEYATDHTNKEGLSYGAEFKDGFNFLGNPQGMVNRKEVGGKVFDFLGTWESRATSILNENNLRINLQAVYNYFEETNGGYLHVEAEKKTNENENYRLVVYVIQDSLVDWQKMPDNSDNEFYIHRDKHLGSIDHRVWGSLIFDKASKQGDKVRVDYSYKLPNGIDKGNLYFLIYAYNTETYEVMQVIKQEIE